MGWQHVDPTEALRQDLDLGLEEGLALVAEGVRRREENQLRCAAHQVVSELGETIYARTRRGEDIGL